MIKCTGNDSQDWGFGAIFDVKCPNCGNPSVPSGKLPAKKIAVNRRFRSYPARELVSEEKLPGLQPISFPEKNHTGGGATEN